MTVFVLGASLRSRSFNATLASLAAREFDRLGCAVDLASLSEFDAPLYNQDLLDGSGFPAGVLAFSHRLAAANAFAIASPEYTFSIPGPLKNLIDWTSQESPIPWRGKPGLLLSASVSSVGGQRGLWALRMPLEALGAHLFPEMFSLPRAHETLDPAGQLKEPRDATALAALASAFTAFADRLTA
jgi:NAD(P)H-dependent FMN reductase